MQADISSSHVTEDIARALKAAREAKGLTQRDLSKRAGVPQAHISKIENNAVDLRLSSLLALAHALDLAVTLVPRKALPAVQSLTRTSGSSFAAPQISKDLARTQQALARLRNTVSAPELDHLRDTLIDIVRLQSAISDRDAARTLRKAVDAIQGRDGGRELKAALTEAKALRKAIVASIDTKTLTPPRPAYRLEDDVDG